MSQMIGMDIAEVRALAQRLEVEGKKFVLISTEISSALRSSTWEGSDAQSFRQRWRHDERTMRRVGEELKEISAVLRTHADEQEQASESGGRLSSSGGWGKTLPGVDLSTLAALLGTLGGPLGMLGALASTHADDLARLADSLGDATLDWLKWLAGPDSPSMSDLTGLVPGLQGLIGDAADFFMQTPELGGLQDLIAAGFGFTYVPGADFYTTNEGSIQSHLGFMDLYDYVHKLGGMDLDDEVIEFTGADGTEYRLELWKGEYMSGGAFGGEVGLYTRDDPGGFQGFLQNLIPGYYSSAEGDDQMRMVQTIYNKETGEKYFTNDNEGSSDGDHYWNLAIRTDDQVSREQLGQQTTLYPNANQREALVTALTAQGYTVDENADGSVSFRWE